MSSQASRGRQPNPVEQGQAQRAYVFTQEMAADPWTQAHIQVQNTFLTVSPPLCETVSGFTEVRRQISDPTSSRSSSLSSGQSQSYNDISSSTRLDGPEGSRQKRYSRERTKREDSPDSGESLRSSCSSSKSSKTKKSKEWWQGWQQERGSSSKSEHKKPQADQTCDYPLDESGEPTSKGSALHAEGTCKPCAFHLTSSGCAMARDCRFCHLPHKSTGKVRLRPCKGKRKRTKRMFDRLTTQIEQDPESFDPTALELPPSIEQNSVVKGRLIGRLKEFADQVRAGRSSASETEDGPEDFAAAAAAAASAEDDAPHHPDIFLEEVDTTKARSSRARP